jgi:hypothetical protein
VRLIYSSPTDNEDVKVIPTFISLIVSFLHQKIFSAKKTKTPAEQFGGSGRGRPAEKSFLAFGAKIGSSVGVKTHQLL